MSWINIGNYLDKFKDFKPSKILIKEELVKIISDTINYDIGKDDLDVRNNTIYLKIKNPGLRSQVFMKKSLILDSISARLGKRAPKDLRF
jgi:hypothetical protein